MRPDAVSLIFKFLAGLAGVFGLACAFGASSDGSGGYRLMSQGAVFWIFGAVVLFVIAMITRPVTQRAAPQPAAQAKAPLNQSILIRAVIAMVVVVMVVVVGWLKHNENEDNRRARIHERTQRDNALRLERMKAAETGE